jgi:hypothetical protein
MRGAVRPRVLAVAAACAACLVALGGIATAAMWGFRNGADKSSSGVAGWLVLVWVGVAAAVLVVVLVALAGVRALRRPLVELSRAANQLQVDRLPSALRAIEAGAEPAPRAGFSAPPELEGVAGALENLERFVHYHAKRAQRADRDLGRLLTGAADRIGARARIAEGIDLVPPEIALIASALHRDADAIRALVPNGAPVPTETPAPSIGPGPSISQTVSAAAHTTLRPSVVVVGELEPAMVDALASGSVMVVLGEVIDAAIGDDGDVVVWGTVQPEGYHVVVDAPLGTRTAELVHVAEALRERDSIALSFGLRAAVQAARRSRLLLWLTVGELGAQWHVLVPPDSFLAAVAPPETPPTETPPTETRPETVPDIDLAEAERERSDGAEVEVETHVEVEVDIDVELVDVEADLARLTSARRLGEALTDLFARLEIALERRARDGEGIEDEERIALLVDGTHLVGELQQAQLCSSRALRSLLRAIDVAVGTDRSVPLAGSARGRVTLPYEALTEIRERIAEAAGFFPAPSAK